MRQFSKVNTRAREGSWRIETWPKNPAFLLIYQHAVFSQGLLVSKDLKKTNNEPHLKTEGVKKTSYSNMNAKIQHH